jgi:hypothetical protein
MLLDAALLQADNSAATVSERTDLAQ